MSVLEQAKVFYVKPNQLSVGNVISFNMSEPYDWCYVLHKRDDKHKRLRDGVKLTVLYRNNKIDKVFVSFESVLVQLK